MRIEFYNGVPPGCIDWLWKNVGPGNVTQGSGLIITRCVDPCATDYWFYEREEVVIMPKDHTKFPIERYVPTITVHDEKQAILFKLKWV